MDKKKKKKREKAGTAREYFGMIVFMLSAVTMLTRWDNPDAQILAWVYGVCGMVVGVLIPLFD